jgi:hypothetical protein
MSKPISPRCLALTALLLLGSGVSSVAHAVDGANGVDRHGVEITPIASFLFAGTFPVDDFELGRLDVDLDSTTNLGLIADFALNRHFQIEVLYLDHQTDANIDFGLLFAPEPLGKVDLQTFQAGVLWQGAAGQIKPYFVLTAGATNLDFELPGANDHTGFSMTFGGGVKAFLTQHLGVRLDGRLFVVDVGSGGSRGYRDECCYQSDSLSAGLLSGGVIFAF